jgi:hypothetical protein
VRLGQADAGKVLCLAFLGVPFPRDCTNTHTKPGWTVFLPKVRRGGIDIGSRRLVHSAGDPVAEQIE